MRRLDVIWKPSPRPARACSPAPAPDALTRKSASPRSEPRTAKAPGRRRGGRRRPDEPAFYLAAPAAAMKARSRLARPRASGGARRRRREALVPIGGGLEPGAPGRSPATYTTPSASDWSAHTSGGGNGCRRGHGSASGRRRRKSPPRRARRAPPSPPRRRRRGATAAGPQRRRLLRAERLLEDASKKSAGASPRVARPFDRRPRAATASRASTSHAHALAAAAVAVRRAAASSARTRRARSKSAATSSGASSESRSPVASAAARRRGDRRAARVFSRERRERGVALPGSAVARAPPRVTRVKRGASRREWPVPWDGRADDGGHARNADGATPAAADAWAAAVDHARRPRRRRNDRDAPAPPTRRGKAVLERLVVPADRARAGRDRRPGGAAEARRRPALRRCTSRKKGSNSTPPRRRDRLLRSPCRRRPRPSCASAGTAHRGSGVGGKRDTRKRRAKPKPRRRRRRSGTGAKAKRKKAVCLEKTRTRFLRDRDRSSGGARDARAGVTARARRARGVRRASSTCVLSRNRRERHGGFAGQPARRPRGKSLRDRRRCLHARLAGRDALEHFSRFDELSVQAGHAVAQGHVRLVLVIIARGALAPHGVPETRIRPRLARSHAMGPTDGAIDAARFRRADFQRNPRVLDSLATPPARRATPRRVSRKNISAAPFDFSASLSAAHPGAAFHARRAPSDAPSDARPRHTSRSERKLTDLSL